MKRTSAIVSALVVVLFVCQGLAFAGAGKNCKQNFCPKNKHKSASCVAPATAPAPAAATTATTK